MALARFRAKQLNSGPWVPVVDEAAAPDEVGIGASAFVWALTKGCRARLRSDQKLLRLVLAVAGYIHYRVLATAALRLYVKAIKRGAKTCKEPECRYIRHAGEKTRLLGNV